MLLQHCQMLVRVALSGDAVPACFLPSLHLALVKRDYFFPFAAAFWGVEITAMPPPVFFV